MDILTAITGIKAGQAAKVPTFSGGYLKRTDVAKGDLDVWDEKFKITFVKYTEGVDTPTEHEFTVTRTGEVYTVSPPATSLVLDVQLFAAFFYSSEWVIGDTADFERARKGSSQNW